MALPSIPTCPPREFVAGDSATWDDLSFTHPLYGTFSAADGWTLTTAFISSEITEPVEIAGVPTGTGWRTSLTTEQSESLSPEHGSTLVTVSQRLTLGSDVVTVKTFQIRLFATADGQAGEKSFARQMVDTLEAALLTSAGSNIISYSFQGRSVQRETRQDVERSLAKWRAVVWREEHPGEVGPAIAMRFSGSALR